MCETSLDDPQLVFLATGVPSVLACVLNPDGAVEVQQTVSVEPAGVAVGWLTAHPSGKWLYVLISHQDQPGELRTFGVHETGCRQLAGAVVPSGGHQPCHAVIHRGHWLAVAHHSGDISIFNVRGGLPIAAGVVTLRCCKDGVDSSRVPSDGQWAHMAHGLAFSPSSRHLLAADAAQGVIVSMEFDFSTGALGSPVVHPTVVVPASDAMDASVGQVIAQLALGPRPRHIAFSEAGCSLMYLQESSEMLMVHHFDSDTGKVRPAYQAISTRAAGAPVVGNRGLSHCLRCVLSPSLVRWHADLAFSVAMRAGMSTASAIAVHTTSGVVLVSHRHLGGGRSWLVALRAFADPLFLPISRGVSAAQRYSRGPTVELGTNARHMVLDPQQRRLLVSVEGGLAVFTVSPTGELSHLATSGLPQEGGGAVTVGCVAVVGAGGG